MTAEEIRQNHAGAAQGSGELAKLNYPSVPVPPALDAQACPGAKYYAPSKTSGTLTVDPLTHVDVGTLSPRHWSSSSSCDLYIFIFMDKIPHNPTHPTSKTHGSMLH